MRVNDQRLHFDTVVEGLWHRALKGRVSDDLRAALKADGLDLSKKPDPAYPAEKMGRWYRLTAKHVFPELNEEDALRALGAEAFRGLTRTVMGAAMMAVLRVLGTRRSLERMTRSMRSGNNYIEATFSSAGRGEATLVFKDVNGLPSYFAGVVEEGGRATGAADMVSTWNMAPDGSCTYHVKWTER
ncbi:MAG: DUF2378 family protein [Myxococcaceae bacterium]